MVKHSGTKHHNLTRNIMNIMNINEWNEKVNEEFKKHIQDDSTNFKGSVLDFFEQSKKIIEER